MPRGRSPGSRCPGVRFQLSGSSIRKNKLWIDFYTSSDVFRGFFGRIVTCKTSYLREAVTHTVTVTVYSYQNVDGL